MRYYWDYWLYNVKMEVESDDRSVAGNTINRLLLGFYKLVC